MHSMLVTGQDRLFSYHLTGFCSRHKEMEHEELRRCQIHEWYPRFKPYSIRTLFHPLPDSFVRYLLGQPISPSSNTDDNADAPPFLLPRTTSGRDPLPRTAATHLDPISSLSLFDSESDDDDEEDSKNKKPSFPELELEVERSIATLGGCVFPKLNWSSPKDAAWISTCGNLRCTSFSDIALLLKASDSIAHDLSHSALDSFVLALRKYYDSLHPEREFRCFVRRKQLIAISQRDVTSCYPALIDQKHGMKLLLEKFFDDIVEPRFESNNYTFDVYVTKEDQRVKLLDFSPWREFTLPLMFDWEELEEEGFGEGVVDFRIVESQLAVRPGLKTAVPYDYLDMGEGSGWDQFLKKADEELRTQQVQNSESDV
ncbi:cell division cycle protein 123-like protein [Iris pallida]|uniref:Cell division cycle protein 123-like protein n=2 Tax=Iris pallida TaxID=29817 RepID=A0AAX6HC42_IRIPA|nr:cell division cycle protein 123-like protein [Iris pallida]KAJ6838630.1 cell division cycle protein 123-like protein [Iris pallida]